MEIPNDISKVGIYKYGAAPGSNGGSIILVSHRDGVGPDPGAFYKLETLRMGNKVTVSENNYTIKYIVTSQYSVKKYNFIEEVPSIFRFDGPPQLVMITCGGKFNFDTQEYTKNIIVVAVPLSYSHAHRYNDKNIRSLFN
jgi:sortase (surface protein transpeptidase)